MKLIFIMLCLLLSAVACGLSNEAPTSQPATVIAGVATKTPASTATAPATFTATPKPTLTPTFTLPPQPTENPSPTPMATKIVLIQFDGSFGGDGGTQYDLYFGRDMPSFVLYTDGQLLIAGEGRQEKTLSTLEMCELLQDLADTGFFQVDGTGRLKEGDPIYKFDATTQFSDGAPNYIIQVNGNPAKQVDVYIHYRKYVASEIKAAYDVISNYRPVDMQPYQPEKLLLWIEKGRGQEWAWAPLSLGSEATATPEVYRWPNEVPPLADFLGDTTEKQVYIQGELVAFILQLPQRYGIFNDKGIEYFVIIRPLLPHETAENYSPYPNTASSFELPFKCGN